MRCEALLTDIDGNNMKLDTLMIPAGYPTKCANALYLIVGSMAFMAQVAVGATPPDEKLDCEVYETEKYGVTAGFSVGNLLLSAGPEVTLSYEQGIAWDKVVQGLIARYVEVCTRYNAGMVSAEQYAQRVQNIEAIYQDAQKYEQQMLQETRDRAKDAFAELDNMIPNQGREQRPSRRPKDKKQSIAQGLQVLGTRIDDLAPISGPLSPTRPCDTPDILGSLGARC